MFEDLIEKDKEKFVVSGNITFSDELISDPDAVFIWGQKHLEDLGMDDCDDIRKVLMNVESHTLKEKTRKIQANWTLELQEDLEEAKKSLEFAASTYPKNEVVFDDPPKLWTPLEEMDMTEDQYFEAMSKLDKNLFDPDTPREILQKEIIFLALQLEMASDDADLLAGECVNWEEEYEILDKKLEAYKLLGTPEQIDEALDIGLKMLRERNELATENEKLRTEVYQLESHIMDMESADCGKKEL